MLALATHPASEVLLNHKPDKKVFAYLRKLLVISTISGFIYNLLSITPQEIICHYHS